MDSLFKGGLRSFEGASFRAIMIPCFKGGPAGIWAGELKGKGPSPGARMIFSFF